MSIPLKVKSLLWFHNTFNKLDFDTLTPKQFRKFSDANRNMMGMLDDKQIPLAQVEDQVIPGSQIPIPIRIYRPCEADNLPVILYFHGGGFVIGSLDGYDNICRRIARDNEAIVVSVDYRLAPEWKYPAATIDCYDATVWVAANCKELGADASRLVVMGDSAGGNLATVTAMKARDLNGPEICYQVLVYPCTDARLINKSISRNGEGYLLTEQMLHWFVQHYVSEDEQKLEAYMSPVLAPDLSKLPPALIQVAEFDPLIDEGIAYAQRLQEAGNHVRLSRYKGLVHAFFTMPKYSKHFLAAHKEIQKVLSTELSLSVQGKKAIKHRKSQGANPKQYV